MSVLTVLFHLGYSLLTESNVDDQWWLRHLNLKLRDHQCLCQGKDLSDIIINAAQGLLKQQFPNLFGFQNTLFRKNLSFHPVPSDVHCVQILHTGQ